MIIIIIILTIILAGVLFFGYFYSEGTRCTIVEYQKDDKIIAIVPNLHMGSYEWHDKNRKYLEKFNLIICENIEIAGNLWIDIMLPYYNISNHIGYRYFSNYHNWIIVDHTMERIHKYYPPDKIEAFKKDVDFLLQFPPFIVKSIFGFRAGWAYHFEQDDPLVKNRNSLPVQEALVKYKKVKRTAIVYGKVHKPGMEKILTACNWVKIREIKTFPFMR